jgi:serine phosphatase RsbU (regulator of sigma subunit)
MEQLLARVERLLERVDMFQSQLDAEIGRDFSQRLLPDRVPDVEGYYLDFYSEPREQGGGDLFDWTEMEDGAYFLTIGDVMGKGLRAKFYAFSFLSYVRGTLHTLLQETSSPAAVMRRINEMLLEDEVLEDTFASFLLMRWDPASDTVTYANAGHCRPVLVDDTSTRIAEHSDLILGLESNASFSDVTLDLPPDTALFAYTDGLMEQPTDDNDMFGENGISALVQRCHGADDPVDALLNEALAEGSADTFLDDVLVVWLHHVVASEEACV